MLGSLQDAGSTVTLSGYLNLLNENCMLTGLQKYSVDLARKRATIPKYQVYNNALLTVYAEESFESSITNHEHWGQIFESAIGSHIINQSFISHYEVYYWREKQDEVDFVLKRNKKLIAIEVKSNRESNTSGLMKFKNLFHPSQAIIIGENGLKPEEFLSMPPDDLF